jgi:hypothetical protein
MQNVKSKNKNRGWFRKSSFFVLLFYF